MEDIKEETLTGSLQVIAKSLDKILQFVKSSQITCPRCKAQSTVTRITMESIGFDCPYCFFEINLSLVQDHANNWQQTL